MIARLLVALRALITYWVWLAEVNEMARTDDALYAADTAALALARHPSPRDCTAFDCAVCRELHGTYPEPLLILPSLDPVLVGRQLIDGEAISDIVRWLECSGWYGSDRGELQRYACWLRRARAEYEQAEVAP